MLFCVFLYHYHISKINQTQKDKEHQSSRGIIKGEEVLGLRRGGRETTEEKKYKWLHFILKDNLDIIIYIHIKARMHTLMKAERKLFGGEEDRQGRKGNMVKWEEEWEASTLMPTYENVVVNPIILYDDENFNSREKKMLVVAKNTSKVFINIILWINTCHL